MTLEERYMGTRDERVMLASPFFGPTSIDEKETTGMFISFLDPQGFANLQFSYSSHQYTLSNIYC
jgi:hypothetical protein